MAINNNLLVWSKDLSKGFRAYGSGTLSFPNAETVGNDMVAHVENSDTSGVVSLSDEDQMISVKPGETYTVAADFRTNHTGEIYIVVKCLDKNKNEIVTLGHYGKRTVTYDTWYRISGTMTVPDGISYIYTIYRFKNTTSVYPSALTLYHPKLEIGNIATEYRPAGVESPNLIQNSHFYSGTNFWNTMDPSVANLYVNEEESLTIDFKQAVDAKHVYTFFTKPLSQNQTYTFSGRIKNNTGSGLFFAWGNDSGTTQTTTTVSGSMNIPPKDGEYHDFVYQFKPGTANLTTLRISSSGKVVGDNINIAWLKIEEGTYQTEWTAAPEDVAIGIDRAVIATAQKTIFDYNDSVGLVANITPNLSMTQQYSPEIEKFTPDWTTNNLVLTASLFKNNSTTNIISDSNVQSVKWYKLNAIDGVNPVLITGDSTYVLGAKTLTIKQNILNNKESADFICEVVYRDPLTQKDLITKKSVTFSRVINGIVLTKARAYLPDGGSLQNGEGELDNKISDNGRNLIRSSNNISKYWAGSQAFISQAGDVIRGVSNGTANPSWPRIWNSSTRDIVFDTDRNYTISFEVRADKDRRLSYGIAESGGREPIMGTGFDMTTTWQKVVYTFMPYRATSQYPYNLYFYTGNTMGDTVSWIEIKNVKLEKGLEATRWSMAPEDYPEIRPETTPKKWMFSMYDNQEASPISIASYSDIKGKTPLKKSLIDDSVNIALNTENHYTGHLQTAIYSPTKRDLPFFFKSKTPTTIYANNEKSYAGGINLVPNSAVEKSSQNIVTYDFNLSEVLTPYIGQEVTVSFDAKADGPDNIHYIDWYLRDSLGYSGNTMMTDSSTETLTSEYKRITQTFVVPSDVAKVKAGGSMAVRTNAYVLDMPAGATNSGSASVKNMKIEPGRIATPWSPSPSDGVNLIGTSNIIAHGSSLVPTDSYEGVPTYLNTVTTPNIGNNFGYKTNKVIPFVSTGPVTFTLSFKYNISAYSNVEQGRPMSGYVRVRNVDGTQSTYRYDTVDPFNTANLNKWNTVVYTFTTDQAITSIDNFYLFGDLVSAGSSMKVTAPKLEVGTKTQTIWTEAPEEEIRTATLPLREGWNTIDVMWTSENGMQTGLFSVQAGGRNVMRQSNKFKPVDNHSTATGVYSSITNEGYLQVRSEVPNGNWFTGWAVSYVGIEDSFAEGDDVVISFEMKSPDHTKNPFIYIKNGMGYFTLKGTMSNEFSQFWYTTKWKKASTVNMHLGWSNIAGTTIIRNVKIEKGTVPSPWTPAPEDVAPADPNMLSTVYKLDDYYTENYANRLTSITAKAELTRASIVDTTNVIYQWYKKDPSVTTNQGGGVGWLKLTSTSPESGYNSDTLIIPSTAVNVFEVYKCAIKDTQIDSVTYNTIFEALVSITNSTLPISVQVETDGTVFLNGQGNKTLKARLFQNYKEVDTEGTIYSYKWYRWLNNGTKDTSWNNGVGYKTGKTLVIGPSDVDQKATFSIDVS